MISAPIVKITDSHKKLFELYRIGPKISFDFFFPFSRVSEERESKATNLSPIEKNSELRFLSEREREREREGELKGERARERKEEKLII